MYCTRCGALLEEDAFFCSQCAAPIEGVAPQRAAEEEASSGTDDEGSAVPGARIPDATIPFDPQGTSPSVDPEAEPVRPVMDSSKKKSSQLNAATKIGIGVACVALIVGIGIVVAANSGAFSADSSSNDVTSGLFYDGPSEEQVMSDLNFEGVASNLSYEGDWYAYQEPTLSSTSELELTYDEADMKEYTITAVYESDDLTTESTVMVDYEKIDGEWVVIDSLETSRYITPKTAPSEDAVINHAPSMMQIADENHPTYDPDENTIELTDLYSDNFQPTIESVEFQAGEGSTTANATISITATDGFTSYNGQLQATLEWDDSDWQITDCYATEGSYTADYSSQIGTWVGEYVENDSSSFNCYAGRYTPARMTIQSVDGLSKTARIDFTVLVHNHEPGSSDNPVESFPGDEIVTVENALVNLDTDSDHLGDYRGERPCDFRIELDRKGGISLTIYSFYNNANMFTYPHDAFVMKKDSES